MSHATAGFSAKLFLTSAITTVGMLSFASTASAQSAGGAWTNFDNTSGLTIDGTDVNNTFIDQHNMNYIGTSPNLNIAASQSVTIGQISKDAMFVAIANGRGTDPTRVLGNLKTVLGDAKTARKVGGSVAIFDRNGVIFGTDSVVDVGGLIVSTAGNINADLNAGTFELSNFDANSQIITRGSITVAEAGVAAFVAPTVRNSGVIKAKMGRVAMAAGKKVTLDLYGDNLVEIAVDEGLLSDGLLVNTGEISAAGGEVIISAQIAKSAVDNVINMSGVVDVTSAKVQGGKIILSGGQQGRVALNGNIKANGKKGQAAGSINATGESIVVTAAAEVKAKGKNGGDAGKIEIIADDTLSIRGLIHATGAEGTGFIETSAPNTFFAGTPSILANREWLLDPTDVVVDAVMETLIEGQLAIGDMTVQTPAAGTDDGNIDLNVVIDWATDKIFKLIADGNVNVNGTGGINATGTGSFEAIAGNDVDVQGDITTQGGVVSLTAGDTASQDDVIVEAAITTNGGNFFALAGDDVFIRDDVSTGGGDVTLSTLDNAGTSTVSVTSVGSIDSGNGDITINSDSIALSTSGAATKLNAGTGTVTVDRVSEGVITLGTGAAYGDLTQGELGTISAAKLVIGGADAGTSKTTTVNVTDVVLNTIPTVELNALATATNAVNFAGTNSFAALTAKANEINVSGGSTAGTSIHFDAPTTNLNGDLVSAAITGTSTTVNVQSDAAQIQDGIDVAAANATVNVAAGTYAESVNVNKSVTLSGANAGLTGTSGARGAEAVVESPGTGFTVSANDVTIDGFKVDGASAASGSNGIDVGAVGGFVAQNNIVTGFTDTSGGRAASGYTSGIGILVDGATGTVDILRNLIDQNTDGVRILNTVAAAVGDVIVRNNDVTSNGDKGIIVKDSDNIQVTNNRSGSNKTGIWLENADNTLVTANTITNSGQIGIRLRTNADNNIIRNNTIDGAGSEGILATNGSDTATIVDNDIDNTKTAISLDGASNSIVRLNDIGLTGGANNIDGNGIALTNASNVRLIDNNVQNTVLSGISANGNTNTLIRENDVDLTGGHGIEAVSETGLVIAENKVGLNGAGSIGQGGVDVNGSNGAILRDNKIENTGENGIRLVNSDNGVVRDNKVNSTGWNGIAAVGGSDNVLITQNKIGLTGGADNIGTHGVKVANSTGGRVIDNKVENTKADGVWLDNADSAVVRDNKINSTGEHGISVENGSSDAVIAENKIGLNGAGSIGQGGVDVNGSNGAIFRDNKIENTGENGIRLVNSDNGVVRDNKVNSTGWNGIAAVGGSDNVLITQNKIGLTGGADNIGTHGVKVANSTGGRVIDNKVENTKADGVWLDNADSAVVRDNKINSTGEHGISVENGSSDVIVRDNKVGLTGGVDNIKGDGIAVDSSDNAHLLSNKVENTLFNGIGVDSSDDALVAENKLNNIGDDAIDFNDVTNSIIRDNKIGLTGGVDNIVDDGVDIEGGSNNRVLGNKIQNTTENGISTLNTDDLIVRENVISMTGENGAYVEGGNKVTLIENNITDTDEDGIKTFKTDEVIARENTIRGTRRDGMDIRRADTVTLVMNTITDTRRRGIYVNRVTGTTDPALIIRENTVKDPRRNAIVAENFTDALVVDNIVRDSRRSGIVLRDGDSVDARRNDIRRTNRDGFAIEDVDTVELINNDTRDTGWDGAYIAGFETALVERNDIRGTGDDGLELEDGDQATVLNNFIRNVGFINSGANADFAGADGISIFDVSGDDAVIGFSVDVQLNDIKRTYDDAIEAVFVGRTKIKENTIKHVGGDNGGDFGGADIFGADGIFVLGAIDSKKGNRFDLKINKNIIDKTADDAIQSLLSGDTQVRKNTITNVGTLAGAGFTGADGINIITGFDVFSRGRPGPTDVRVSIVKNDISDALDDGVEVWGASDLTVDQNVIDGSGDDGINILGFNSFNGVTLLPSYDAVVTNNTVTNSGTDGIQSEGFTNAFIDTNTVTDSAEIGINVSGFNNGITEVSNNTLTDNDIGLQFESGVADLTGPGNTFTNGRVGIRFAPYDLSQRNISSLVLGLFGRTTRVAVPSGFADLSLVDDDGAGGFDGTIGAQTFDSQVESYVELDNGAFFAPGTPSILNALDSTYLNTPFGNVTPSVDFPDGFTADQLAYFESKFVHFTDDNSLGFFFFPPDVDQERVFNAFDPAAVGIAGLNVTILGLPNLPGNIGNALNNIATFAGGNTDGTEDLVGLTPEQLNNIETAAGGDEPNTCWSDALNQAESGGISGLSFSGSAEDLLNAEAACSL